MKTLLLQSKELVHTPKVIFKHPLCVGGFPWPTRRKAGTEPATFSPLADTRELLRSIAPQDTVSCRSLPWHWWHAMAPGRTHPQDGSGDIS